jgi:O-antigen/teichoic acid export membrane protein
MAKSALKITQLIKSQIFVNSSWGILSQALQSIFLSLFFIIIARNYPTELFASFIIATSLYQLIAAFSSLGLSQWFIREITGSENKKDLVNKFFKIQLFSGVLFYALNILLGLILYDDKLIHILVVLLGINIVFDNLINAIKCINISEFKQKKTFVILSIDAFLKFGAACFLYVYPFSIITLSAILVVARFVTLNLFLNIGSSRLINLNLLIRYKISLNYIKRIIVLNWPFIIIGSVSIINWRFATIIISKALLPLDVANYEISYRVFSIALMLPVVVSTTVFPMLINFFKENKVLDLSAFYRKMHFYYLIFGLFSFTFIYSFIDFILPILFGPRYSETGIYTKQMFLTILVFPTAFLQANVLVAMKLEKLDMWFNVVMLIVNIIFCIVGLYFYKSLLVVNVSIFSGFLLFRIFQDIILIKKNVSSGGHVFNFYALSILSIVSYLLLGKFINSVVLFPGYWIGMLGCYFLIKKLNFKKYQT